VKQLSIQQLKQTASESPTTAYIDGQVQSVITKTTKGGKPYLELTFSDAAGSFTLKIWENLPQFQAAQEIPPHTFLRLTGDWVQNQYGIDGVRWDMRPLNQPEIAELLTGDPETSAQQAKDWNDISKMLTDIADPRLHGLCQLFVAKYEARFRRTAAARKNHHARRGGLVEHVAQMMRCAHAICTVYPDLNRDLLTAGVLFHDCGKMWENSYPETGFTQPYDLQGELLGHIPLGIDLANRLWGELELSEAADTWDGLFPTNEQVRLHLLHLIASHHGTYEFGSPTLPKTPEAHALHHVDNLDAKHEMLKGAYQKAPELADGIYERQFPLPGNLIEPLAHFPRIKDMQAAAPQKVAPAPAQPEPTENAPAQTTKPEPTLANKAATAPADNPPSSQAPASSPTKQPESQAKAPTKPSPTVAKKPQTTQQPTDTPDEEIPAEPFTGELF